MRKYLLVILLALGVIALPGCRNSVNERNLSAAMNRYFEKWSNQCLNGWIVDKDVSEEMLRVTSELHQQAAALEAAGLVSGTDVEIGEAKIKGKHYTPTEAAKPFVFKWKDGHSDLCWAKKKLDKIVKWEGPGKTGEYQGSIMAFYTYKLDNVADWARRPDIQAAFRDLKRTLDGADEHREEKIEMRLTNLGWETLQ
jgi:hypothetical protein